MAVAWSTFQEKTTWLMAGRLLSLNVLHRRAWTPMAIFTPSAKA
jgi:hypothetical protein